MTFSLTNKIRFVTAASLFDGHDATIHVMRRILQAQGAEVIHLGHNRSVKEVVDAAIQEDVQGIAVTSYQGGHIEYFSYMLELLKAGGAPHIKVFGGGGGVIVPDEIKLLESRGVTKIFSPDDGIKMGLVGMIQYMLAECDFLPTKPKHSLPNKLTPKDPKVIAEIISQFELADLDKTSDYQKAAEQIRKQLASVPQSCPILGFTGTGGAGKSSLIDEILVRFLRVFPQKTIAVLSVDPTRKRSGGALLGDRIRMNSLKDNRIFARSMATRRANLSTSSSVKDTLSLLSRAGFDAVILETAGIGQSDSEITELCELPVYVMTPEFGAASQLEKIDMLDFAELICINKFDKPKAEDALTDVQKAVQRNKERFKEPPANMPVFGTSAHRFNDLGTNKFFNAIFTNYAAKSEDAKAWDFEPLPEGKADSKSLIPKKRSRYLAEIAEAIREHHDHIEKESHIANQAWAHSLLEETEKSQDLLQTLSSNAQGAVKSYEGLKADYEKESHSYEVRGTKIEVANYTTSLAGQKIPKVAVPRLDGWGDRVRFFGKENLPGYFPFTAGVFPYKRKSEDPTRMFAGEGTPERTNKRFHYLSKDAKSHRLSTAFDSVTLYGEDPGKRPDIFGKIGNAGVSVCTLDDAKRLYSGIDLCDPSTSVSMTINGPAPSVLAFFFNAAIDAECERRLKKSGSWPTIDEKINQYFQDHNMERPIYRADTLPEGHDGSGLGFLGLSSQEVVDAAFYEDTKKYVLQTVRGTVQADILKEDQAQNTCIFSTEYAMRMMGDIQEFFSENGIRNFYSISISGYHIAEAGANPITQLAFTLANGFCVVEYYRGRGIEIDAFAPNLSFFFSNGLDPEYSVIGRVARRIWAIAMKTIYKGNERSQKLKYHIQTSGRSLHAQEIAFNDIRTTLQALSAISDNCNSLHTNAYDEAITTPTEDSVRRALAIQLVINQELGLMRNENPLQGAYIIDQLTDLVEKAVLKEFESLDARGGVLGAMESMYQRSKIQEESMLYEHQKHSGELPIVGVNTFLAPKLNHDESSQVTELIRSTEAEKKAQIAQVEALRSTRAAKQAACLKTLEQAVLKNENTFEALLEATKYCTLGTLSNTLYKMGGAYRRNM